MLRWIVTSGAVVGLALACCGCSGMRYTFYQSAIDSPAGVSIVTQVGVSSDRMLSTDEVESVLDRLASVAARAALNRMLRDESPVEQEPPQDFAWEGE